MLGLREESGGLMTDYENVYREQSHYFGLKPSPLLVDHLHRIRAGGRVLDVGVGQGRHALALARRGFEVTGLDTCSTAIDVTQDLATQEGLSLQLRQGNVFDLSVAEGSFDAILLFGLFQCLTRTQNARLAEIVTDRAAPSGLVFVTAWHIGDPSYETAQKNAEPLADGSFRLADGEARSYLQPNEILQLFSGWTVVHHWEGFGPWHRHGDGEPQRHGLVELVARAPL